MEIFPFIQSTLYLSFSKQFQTLQIKSVLRNSGNGKEKIGIKILLPLRVHVRIHPDSLMATDELMLN